VGRTAANLWGSCWGGLGRGELQKSSRKQKKGKGGKKKKREKRKSTTQTQTSSKKQRLEWSAQQTYQPCRNKRRKPAAKRKAKGRTCTWKEKSKTGGETTKQLRKAWVGKGG